MPKTDDDSSSSKSPLHPVYTVSNIQHKVRVLDGVKTTYTQWVKLFNLHAKGYKVRHHIDGTATPAPADPTYGEWSEIDAIVLQWIYGTLSDELLPRVLEEESTAREAWLRVEQIFLNNKGARAAALEQEFNNLKLASMPSLEAYCTRLRELSGQLKDVGSAVNDQRLVLQLVRGLPTEYDTVGSYIHQTMPSFETARSMLELEHHRKSSRDEPSTALVAPRSPPPESSDWADATRPTTNSSNNNRGRGGGRGGRNWKNNRGGWRGGRNGNGGYQQQWQQNSWQQQTPSWGPPPCPYPTYPGWTPPQQQQQQWQQPTSGRGAYAGQGRGYRNRGGHTSGQAHVAEYDSNLPTELAQAFNTMAIQPYNTDGSWIMDTGASSHLTSDPGFTDWDYDLEEQQ